MEVAIGLGVLAVSWRVSALLKRTKETRERVGKDFRQFVTVAGVLGLVAFVVVGKVT